ncbi:MAG TPA: CHC2 zinc finger domain-containing protein [Verrucomicrobiae bacterium]|nr:CHC2 zinc finger domain-containing protein [Verrucomicrobiae bacterium]
MAGFSQATLERIRAASDIVDVIGASLPLKKAGGNFTALCPFHKEKSPSFNVNPHKQIFHCFGCHKGGDVFTFVKEFENIGFVDAVRRLAERAKIPLEMDEHPAEQQSRHLKDELLQIHEQLTQRWQNCLLNEAAGQPARDYLAKRGVSAEAIKLFRLGAAPDAWDDTVNWAKSKNYELPLVEKAGLIIKKSETPDPRPQTPDAKSQTPDAKSQTPDARPETRNYYDRFRGRLMFPIGDEQGRVIGFSGRILTGDEKTAKYVNSPETAIFTKSKVFFGLDKSKRALLDAQSAIVCEGQLDLIACFMAGVQNVVAPQGTAFTDQHARIIKRYVDEVVLCFDSDEAGQNAAVRSLDHLLASGIAVRVAVMPKPHDPDSFIKANGGEAFRQLVAGADGFFDYYLNRLCAQNDAGSDKGRLAILRDMAEAVGKTGSAVLVDKYAQKTALRLGVSPEAVRAEFKKNPAAHVAPRESEEESFETAEPEMARPSAFEFHLLKLLFLHDELVPWLSLHLDPEWISHPQVRQVVGQRIAAQREETWQSLGAFLDGCDSPGIRSLVTEAVTQERKLPNLEQQLADVTLKLRNQFLDRKIAACLQRASQPEISDADKIELLREQQQLREQKRTGLSAGGEG